MDFDIIRLMPNLFWVNMHSRNIVLAKTGYKLLIIALVNMKLRALWSASSIALVSCEALRIIYTLTSILDATISIDKRLKLFS